MRLKNILALLVMAIFVASTAFAQEAAAPVKEEKPKASVSGVLFFDYSYLIEEKEKVGDDKETGQDSMNLTRAYVTFKNKIDDMWSVKVTLDGGNLSTKDDNGDKVADSRVYVKNAYLQMANNFGAADLKVQFGQVGTPIIGLHDGLGGSRWIYNNYVDKSADLFNKDVVEVSFDAGSADTGIKADINVMKMVTITGMYSNGDGYKTNTSDQDKVTKAYYGVLNITPIKALNIFGYYHWRDFAGDADKNFISYMGGGLAWKDKAIMVGGSYTIADGEYVDGTDYELEATILQFWVNVNLQQFVGSPILILGRYALGSAELKTTGSKAESDGSIIWAGIGYKVNSNVQIALMYNTKGTESKLNSAKTEDFTSSTIYVKSEAKF